jgi:uncharacterized protein (TIGR02265 family)
MQSIKGSVLAARIAFVRERAGNEGLARVLQRLPADEQNMLKLIMLVRWYPFDMSRRLDEAIVAELGGGDRKFFESLGEESAERNLTTVHASFLVRGDPMAFLAKTRTIYETYYEGGRREFEKVTDKSALLTTYDAEAFSTADCLTVIGWYRRALALCGATQPVVEELTCRAKGGQYCRYRCSWR